MEVDKPALQLLFYAVDMLDSDAALTFMTSSERNALLEAMMTRLLPTIDRRHEIPEPEDTLTYTQLLNAIRLQPHDGGNVNG